MLYPHCFQLCFRRVQVNQNGLKLNGTHQLLVYTDYVNILGGSIHTIKENAQTFVETGLEINADKTKYMVFRIQGEVTVRRPITVPLKGWKSSDIWEQL